MTRTRSIKQDSLFFLIFILLFSNFISTSVGNTILLNDSLKSPENLFFLEDNMTITTSKEDKYQNGVNMFGLFQGTDTVAFESNNSYLTFIDMNGKFLIDPLVSQKSKSFMESTWINQSTVLTNYEGNPMLWNIGTNQTEIFEFQNIHPYDMQYNPTSQTFLILEYFVKPIRNGSNDLEIALVSKVSEYDRSGMSLWNWDFSISANLSIYYNNIERLNVTRDTQEYNTVIYPDPIHANSMYWDKDNETVIVNLRNLNQFAKINYNTRVIEWFAGQGGNFTLYNKNNTEVESLWYRASDVNPIGNNEFLLFDNNYRNLTDPLSNFTSSLLHIKVDPINGTIHEIFRWEGPQTYAGYQWGSARKLSNGNYLAGFGAAVHSAGPDKPSNHTLFGGVAVEITPTGEKVWEMKLPYNWGFNRIDRIIPNLYAKGIPPIDVDVGTSVDLIWDKVFSNFPKKYKITLNKGTDQSVVLDEDEWNHGSIEYKLTTGELNQGQHIITLTLTNFVDNETEVATKITILFPNQSKKDKTSILDSFLILNSLLIIMIIYRKRSISYNSFN